MDIKRLQKAVNWIAENPNRFHMKEYIIKNDCGSTMCLGGVICMQEDGIFSLLCWAETRVYDSFGVTPSERAAKLLGITYQKAMKVFLEFGIETVEELVQVINEQWKVKLTIPNS